MVKYLYLVPFEDNVRTTCKHNTVINVSCNTETMQYGHEGSVAEQGRLSGTWFEWANTLIFAYMIYCKQNISSL